MLSNIQIILRKNYIHSFFSVVSLLCLSLLAEKKLLLAEKKLLLGEKNLQLGDLKFLLDE